MKYLVDCDGVIRKFTESIMRFDSAKNLPLHEWRKLPNDLWFDIDKRTKYYLYDCNCYEDMVKHIKMLIEHGNDITFVTNQCGIVDREKWTRLFIEKYFGNDIKVIFTTNFQEKIDLLVKNKDAILLDDYSNFYQKEGFDRVKNRIYLIPRPWNVSERYHFSHVYKIVNEIWKDIKGYEGLYQISNYGRVKSLIRHIINKNGRNITKKEKIMKLTYDRDGYLLVGLNKDKKQTQFRVHRLVLINFVNNVENKPETNHLNSIRDDNRLINLQWCTRSENSRHSYRQGNNKGAFGEKSGSCILTENEVHVIRGLLENTALKHREIAEIFNISCTTVCDVKSRKSWKHI